MKRTLSFVLVLLFLIAAVSVSAAERCEGPGFATPTEAARAYLEAINAGDIGSALSTFAIETYAEHFDTKAYIQCVACVGKSIYQTIPTAGTLGKGLLAEKRRSDIVNHLWMAYTNYSTMNADLEWKNDFISPLKEDEKIDAVVSRIESVSADQYIGRLHITGSLLPTNPLVRALLPVQYFSEPLQKNIRNRCNYLGADELTDVLVLFDIGGEPYVQTMECVRYGETWYNQSLMSTICMILNASTDSGGILPISGLSK